MPLLLLPEDRKRHTVHLPTFRFSLANSLSAPVAGYWPRSFRNTVRGIPQRCGFIFALAASVAPVGLIVFRRYIRVPEVGRQDVD